MTTSDYKRYRCGFCALEFESPREKRYCSKKCNKAAIRKNKASVPRAEYLAKVRENSASKFNCEHCGKEAHRKLGGANKKRGITNRWCSMQCKKDASLAKRMANRGFPFSKVWAAYCLGCGKPFVSRRKKAYCCEGCWPEREYIGVAPSVKTCKCCGKEYAPTSFKTRPTDYCGVLCKAAAASAFKRIDRSRRKAVTKAATIENVDPYKVFDRDRWRCQLCGIKTPKDKRGTYDDDAPELDHIIPLSKGGEHSYRNTQCACRQCNGMKAAKPLGQLLLIG